MSTPLSSTRSLSVFDAVLITVGVIVGAGIFRTPSVVAANAGSAEGLVLLWVAGGAISLIGALCYAELASSYPERGGEYHFVSRAFGPAPGFLFAWARMTVIQTGSIAMLAFLIGDYAAAALGALPFSSAHYAAATVVALSAVNIAGIRQGKGMQTALIALLALGLCSIIVTGSLANASVSPAQQTSDPSVFGRAMIFVLLTFGGWNEAAYLSADVQGHRRNIVRVLLYSIAAVTLLYLAVNLALLKGLGLGGMSASDAVAADLMRLSFGEAGAALVSLLIVLACLSTMNATIITGARTTYALGRDFRLLRFLGRWREGRETPVNALLLQGGIALLLVIGGAKARNGFESMVDYTAPVFWFFFALIGLSLFVLRRREPHTPRPFRVPLYPLLPLLFIAVCLYMLYSSLAFTGMGALFGGAVLVAGIPVFFLLKRR